MVVPKSFEKRLVETSFGRVAVAEAGPESKPPVLLVHGIPTSSYLWRHPMRLLQRDFHCYAPDLLGLGDSEADPARGIFGMEAQAEMLAELMTALGHQRFGLVCHDQGGAAAQILATRFEQRVRCLVLTDCVCYDNWPVPAIERLQYLARLPLLAPWLARAGVLQWVQTSTPLSDFGRGVFRRSALSDEAVAEYLRPLRAGGASTARFLRFLLAGSARSTLQVVPALRRLQTPTLVLWAADDRFISPSWGVQLTRDIPGAERLVLIPFCGHFWQEERPAEFVAPMAEFLTRHLKQEQTSQPLGEVSNA